MEMNLEKAFEIVNKIRIDFFDNKYKTIYTDDEVEEKYEALGTILRYIKYNSISKEVIEKKVKELDKTYEDSKDENGESEYYYPNYTIQILEELLEEK